MTTTQDAHAFTAFEGFRRLASGSLETVSVTAAEAVTRGNEAVLVFDDRTGRQVDLDLRGSSDEIRAWARGQAARLSGPDEIAHPSRRGRGRPRLGVVGKEVTLLPRHWAWLDVQPGGASATLRRLVEQARKDSPDRDRTRDARDATYRFLAAIAGNLPGYEEALRALYRGDPGGFRAAMEPWPRDIVDQAAKLAAEAFGEA